MYSAVNNSVSHGKVESFIQCAFLFGNGIWQISRSGLRQDFGIVIASLNSDFNWLYLTIPFGWENERHPLLLHTRFSLVFGGVGGGGGGGAVSAKIPHS